MGTLLFCLKTNLQNLTLTNYKKKKMRALSFTARRFLSQTPKALGAQPFPNYDYSEGPHETSPGSLRGYSAYTKPEKFQNAGKKAGNESLLKFLVFDSLRGSDRLDYWLMSPQKNDPRFRGGFMLPTHDGGTNSNPLTDEPNRKASTGSGLFLNGFVLCCLWIFWMINPQWQFVKMAKGEDWRKHNTTGW